VSDAGAFVEVVTFPKGYRQAEHDLFGSLLRTAAHDAKKSRQGELSAASNDVRCLTWVFEDGENGGVVCCSQFEADAIPEGVVAWFSGSADDGVVTVRIAYKHPKAMLPGRVVDNYLGKYASAVPKNPTWHHDWETKDLEKWVELLGTHKDDLVMLQACGAYLTRYDKRSFGLLDALKKRDDPAAYSQALDGVVERLGQVAAERKATARAPGQRGE